MDTRQPPALGGGPSWPLSRLVRPFAGLRIGVRLTACFGLLLMLVAASDLIALWQVASLSREVRVLYLVDLKSASVERIQADILDYSEGLQRFAQSGDPQQFRGEAERLSALLQQRSAAAREAILVPGAESREDPALLTMLASIQSTLPGQTATLTALAQAGDWRAVQMRLDKQEATLARLSSSLAGRLELDVSEQRRRVLADTQSVQQQIFLVLPLALALTLVVAGFLTIVVTQTITGPLGRLDEAAHALALGDFSRHVPADGHDELANLGRVFNDSASRLSDYYSALQQSEAKFRSYIQSSPIGLFVADQAGRFVDFNRAVVHLLGYDADTLRRLPIHDLVSAEQHSALTSFLQLPDGRRITGEWDLRACDGRWVPVSIEGVGLAGDLAMGYLFDLTERRQAEQERERLRAQFLQAQKMEPVGRLAGGVAHDFNNLLTVINGYAALGLSRAAPDDPHRDSLDQILRAGERAAALVQQLLAFSRKQVLKQEVIDLNQVVREISAMAPRLMGEDVAVTLCLTADPLSVLADRHQIGQVLLNLIVNARDAMPHGGTLTIETRETQLDPNRAAPGERERAPGTYACLMVKDSGAGMDAVTREHLFEPFFTTKDAGKGTGLGLATAQGIVLQSGGYIDVESRPGEGSTFSVYLPAVPAAAPAPAQPAVGETAAAGTETILVVEDQAAVREFAASALADLGYQVSSAGSAEEALRFLAGKPVDLLVTDVIMPQADGYELAAGARRLYPGLRLLFMSGFGGDRQRDDAPQDAPLLAKPFSARQLAAKVREVLDQPANMHSA